MASDSSILDSINAGIAKVLEAIAAGDWLTEWKEGPLSVKKESPAALLRTLQDMAAAYEATTETRSAGVAISRGAR